MELLRDRSAEFEAIGVRPLGLSRDSAWTHIAWMQALDLTFGLLSDWNGEAVRGFDAGQDYRGMKDVPQRAAFLIDGQGEVRGAWNYANDEVPDFDELMAAARAL
jgi:glutaredoxin-dependent peroxiredoxin